MAETAADFPVLPEVPRIAFETLPEIGFLQGLVSADLTALVQADARLVDGPNRFTFGAAGVVLGAFAAEPDVRTGPERCRVSRFGTEGHGSFHFERTEGGGGRGKSFIALEQSPDGHLAVLVMIQDDELDGGKWSIVSGRTPVEGGVRTRQSQPNPVKGSIPRVFNSTSNSMGGEAGRVCIGRARSPRPWLGSSRHLGVEWGRSIARFSTARSALCRGSGTE